MFLLPFPPTALSMATMDLSRVGRGGLAGALSAMDGAKRGTQDADFAVPRQPTPPHQHTALQTLPLPLPLPLPLLLQLQLQALQPEPQTQPTASGSRTR